MVKHAAGFIIFKRLGTTIQYLLMQTSYGHHWWTPPKGHVDCGEETFDTAVRETMEEAGLLLGKDFSVVDKEKFQVDLSYPVKGEEKRVTYWLGKLENPSAEVKLSSEHQAYEWKELEEACRLVQYNDMIEALRKCDGYLRSHS